MTRLSEAVLENIEPAARGLLGETSDDVLVVFASIAVSLRRMADAGENRGPDIVEKWKGVKP